MAHWGLYALTALVCLQATSIVSLCLLSRQVRISALAAACRAEWQAEERDVPHAQVPIWLCYTFTMRHAICRCCQS